jgi:hypothetical protein
VKKIFRREVFFCILLVIGGLLLGTVVSEFGLRAYHAVRDGNSKYCVWPPKMQKVFQPTPGTMPGVSGPTRFLVNSDGIRGDELTQERSYRILAIGGSTTECLFLDQEKSWPSVLQKKLNGLQGPKAWVGNAGKSGLSTREHYMYMKYLVPQFQKLDTIIILAGFNDLARRLIEDTKYDPSFLDHYEYWKLRLIRGAFSDTPYYAGKYRFRSGYYDESAIGSLVVGLMDVYSKRKLIQDESGSMFVHFRNLRKNARQFVNDLPDLKPALEEYERNLGKIADMAQARSIRLIFVTQPSMYRMDMTQAEKDLLWCGWIESMGASRYYTDKAMLEGLRKYNETLKNFCRGRQIDCIDLDPVLPKNTAAFYDDAHFNDQGSVMVADAIFQFLKQKAPFASSGEPSQRTQP